MHNKSLRHVNLFSQFIQHMLVVHTRLSVKLYLRGGHKYCTDVSFKGLNFMVQEDDFMGYISVVIQLKFSKFLWIRQPTKF